jgi:transcriptional regulator with PAS, ATPase and Fis domain
MIGMAQRVLVSWIGHTDLRAFARGDARADRAAIEEIAGVRDNESGVGPVKALIDLEQFDEVHLLSDYSPEIAKPFAKWLGCKCKLHRLSPKNPSDHGEVLQLVRPMLESLKLTKEDSLNLHLSPGTPAMAAIWILLAKSLFPATLYQTYGGKALITEIPFDITVDVIPQLMREPDRFWQHLQVQSPQEIGGFERIVGNSPALRTAVGRAQRAAIHEVPVLILGESGTGKEMFADAIHKASGRRNKKMFSINCAAISRELIESELFGHVKGAFTGAANNHVGLFEQAHGSTLFLDEIGECDLGLQAKLLRALQPPDNGSPCQRVFRPVGATEERVADVRIVAATNRNLHKLIEEGKFREDLYHRVATITLKLPPLRERGDDVMLLAERLLDDVNNQFATQLGGAYKRKSLGADTKKFIRHQPWRGNIRELRNAVVQACVMAASDELAPEDIAAAIAEVPGQVGLSLHDVPLGGGFSLDDYLGDIQRRFLMRAMDEAAGVKNKAAELLGLDNYQTLSNRLKKYESNQD